MTQATTSAQTGFFIGATFREAWQLFKKNWLKVWGIILMPIILGGIYSMLIAQMQPGVLLSIIAIAYVILQLAVSMGVTALLLRLTRGQELSLSVIEEMLPRIGNYLLAMILYVLIVIAGLLLLIVPGIVWGIKFMFTPYLIIDKNMNAIDALKASSKLTQGVKWDLVGFSMAVQILVLFGLLAFFVGLIIAIPVASISMVLVYDQLLKRAKM